MAMSDWGGEGSGGGVLSSNFVHQMCHQGGREGGSLVPTNRQFHEALGTWLRSRLLSLSNQIL